MMHKDIVKFITKHHVAALSMQDGEGTWSSNCFYAFAPADHMLVFLSHGDTLHAQLLLRNPRISGAISEQTKSVLKIQGIQFKGTAELTDSKTLRQLYNKRFPFASVVDATLWAVRLNTVKFTSNIVKFGKKLHWESKSPHSLL